MNPIEQDVRQWLENVVIGLDLCPFARHPLQQHAVRFFVTDAADDVNVLADLQLQMQAMDETPAQQLETTLVIVPNHLQAFEDYNDFLDSVDWLLEQNKWAGVYQVASFHPDYRFAGTLPQDQENLTNRAPYPILHILREDSIERALAHYPDADAIPTDNIEKMERLSAADVAKLFPYLGTRR